MSYQIESNKFINDLDKVAKVRGAIADSLGEMTATLTRSETESDTKSGRLGLEREIDDLTKASKNLSQGVFRLLVLGDMKRGKSTFLNALIGEN